MGGGRVVSEAGVVVSISSTISFSSSFALVSSFSTVVELPLALREGGGAESTSGIREGGSEETVAMWLELRERVRE